MPIARSPQRLLRPARLALALLVAACGDAATPDGATDASAPDLATTPSPDQAALADLATRDDLTLPAVKEKLTVLPISATGHDRYYGVAFNKAGELFATGQVADSTDASTDYATVVSKLNPDGTPVAAFGKGGHVITNLAVGLAGELARGIGVQSTGKIVVSATVEHFGAKDPRDRDVAVLRLNPDGTRDASFGEDGLLRIDLSEGEAVGNGFVADSNWALIVQPDDKLVLSGGLKRTGGTDSDYYLLRLTESGARDATFGDGGLFTLDVRMQNASPRNMTLLDDGSLLGAGYMAENGANRPVVFKVDSSGKLAAMYGMGGFFNDAVLAAQTEVYAVAPQGDKVVTIGYGRDNAMTESVDWLSLRLDKNGALDPTWGTKGVLRFDVAGFADNARFVLPIGDGRIVFSGGGRPVSDNVDGMLAVATTDGAPDTHFGPKGFRLFDLGGPADHLWAMALSPDRRTLAAVGIKGVGATVPGDGGVSNANDDAVLLILPAP